MNTLKNTILNYRDKFRRLPKQIHILIGFQIVFLLGSFRFHRYSKSNDLITNIDSAEQQQLTAENRKNKIK